MRKGDDLTPVEPTSEPTRAPTSARDVAPDAGAARPIPSTPLLDVDLSALQQQMAATIERAKADDPQELKRQIAALKAEKATLERQRSQVKPAATGKAIERAVFPGGAASQSQRNDVDIVFNALKYGATLITNDGGSKRQPGGILGNRDRLADLGVRVMTPPEAVRLVRQRIAERDERARRSAERDGKRLPEWVGKD